MKFLIQTIDSEVKHDFSFHLIKSIEYNNWFYNNKMYDFILSDLPIKVDENEKYIPIGSLEFVFSYLKDYHKITDLKPINIPNELMIDKFLKRNVWIKKKENLSLNKPYFIKSNTKYKSFIDITNHIDSLPNDEFFISEVMEIDSEWRVFVHNNEMVGLRQYQGDFKTFPDVPLIEEMIKSYNGYAPTTYTLDVGVSQIGTFIIEIHPFISCGLYGFDNYKILPNMFISAFSDIVKYMK